MTNPGTEDHLPQRKHLRRLERITVPGAPLFFLTACVRGRLPLLAEPQVADILARAWRHSQMAHGWLVGRYVIMPDHVHFFASPMGEVAKDLARFMNYWKRSTAIRVRKQLLRRFSWQTEFFDHLLRSDESYEEKWTYVWHNPVRAGLVTDPSDWPYQGEINVI